MPPVGCVDDTSTLEWNWKSSTQIEFRIMEQRRFEECSVAPGPDNDVMVGSALVVWSPSLISVYKSSAYENCPIATSARALDHLFDVLPAHATIQLLL
jgi:hypothetical protein